MHKTVYCFSHKHALAKTEMSCYRGAVSGSAQCGPMSALSPIPSGPWCKAGCWKSTRLVSSGMDSFCSPLSGLIEMVGHSLSAVPRFLGVLSGALARSSEAGAQTARSVNMTIGSIRHMTSDNARSYLLGRLPCPLSLLTQQPLQDFQSLVLS